MGKRPSIVGAAARERGFTLIELLVVIAVIALLVSILVPSLSKVRSLARKTVCASLMKGYALATEMYVAGNKGMMMDSYAHLSSTVGIPRYWGQQTLPQNISRCPYDQSTEAIGRLGNFPQFGGALVSIGCNENMLSCSARATSKGPMAFWVNREKLVGTASQLMTWTDWQNNPYVAAPTMAVVKPAQGAMGSLAFRHDNNTANAAFLDGHVGELQAKIELANNGHDLSPGVDWGITGAVAQMYKCYYPFGVGASQTVNDKGCKGIWPAINIK